MRIYWLYSCCFVGCCFKDLLKTANSFLVYFQSSFFPHFIRDIRFPCDRQSIDSGLPLIEPPKISEIQPTIKNNKIIKKKQTKNKQTNKQTNENI